MHNSRNGRADWAMTGPTCVRSVPGSWHQWRKQRSDSILKIVNDAAVAVNQGGKRKGAVCAFLNTWHLDFEEFLDLRKNTGDDRRRTHDMHTAAWIPDLFMQRIREGAMWTLFCPSEPLTCTTSTGINFAKGTNTTRAKQITASYANIDAFLRSTCGERC